MTHDPVSAVASWLTPADTTDDDTDAELRSLFAAWVAAERHPDAVSGEDEAAHEAALERIFEAVDQLADLPATGIVGLAVKAYVCILRAHGGTLEDPAALRDYVPDPLERSTLEDVLRILPEEAPRLVSMAHGAGDP